MPTIDEMITLVEEQIVEINKDEQSFDANLDFIHETLESILITRRDTFKEQLTRFYKEKDDEVRAMKDKVKIMERNEKMLEVMRNRLKDTTSENESFKQQIEEIKSATFRSQIKGTAKAEFYDKIIKERNEAKQSLIEA